MKPRNRTAAYLFALLIGATPLATTASSGGGGSAEGTYPGYMALDPPLVVNLANPRKSRFLRLDLQFYIETPEDATAITAHMPRLRDRMISFLGGRDGEQMMTPQARDQLRSELLASLRETMTAQTGKPAISAIYFTGFIIQ